MIASSQVGLLGLIVLVVVIIEAVRGWKQEDKQDDDK